MFLRLHVCILMLSFASITVSAQQCSSGTPVNSVSIATYSDCDSPYGVAINPFAGAVYVACQSRGVMSVSTTSSSTSIATIANNA